MIFVIAYALVAIVVFRLAFGPIVNEFSWGEPDVADVGFAAFFAAIVGLLWGIIVPLGLAALLIWVIVIPGKFKPEGTRVADWVEDAKYWLEEREQAAQARKAERTRKNPFKK